MKSRIRGLLDSPVWPAMRLVYQASPKHAVVTTASIVIQALLGLSGILISGNLIGAIDFADRNGIEAARDQLVLFVGLGVAVALLSTGLGVLNDAVSGGLGLRFFRLTRAMAMDASLSPKGIAHLEDPKFMDELKVAQGQDYASHPTQIVGALSQILSSRVAAVGSAVFLFGFHWWAPLLLMAAMVVHYRWMNKELDAIWKPWTDSSPELRRSRYYRHLALDTPAAKEIRVFGLAPWVVDRFGERWFAGMNAIWRERKRLKGEMIRALAVLVIAFGAVYVVMAMDGATGRITIEQITIFAQATIGMYGFGAAGDSQLLLRNSSNSIKHLLALPKEAAERVDVNEGGMTETDAMPVESIKFEDVSFHYPGTERPIFDGLNLEIPSGKSLAIVGDNGAGKTTLVKLLARLYDPNSGRITVDGIDLKLIDPHAWRERVSVIFQDFVKYQLPAKQNVGFGALDLSHNQESLDRAAKLAGADKLIRGLDKGWDTVLSRQFKEGTDLSGGQWQKVALARALFATEKGGVLVLDEPTANLDVRSEAQLFERFLELTHGITTVLISHRFSTVRHAEIICVLEQGKLIEQGNHDELLELNGKYARMFLLQADRFRDKSNV